VKQARRSFLKKRTKKLLSPPAFQWPDFGPSNAAINKSFFASFFAKKEVLPSLTSIGL
jgi:hypothetical protein